ncbi:hypothetical protein [Polynucleobacter sp. MWH-UH35A]|uniref:hypothetical protein n=1 Tax=Polynucleobacter sp. MWH-UH35A TaxID=1855619 RepID=UPI001BFD5C21|nr:hypothetical protein [Polynucleobacter sp. MWH-UH35A]QWD59696.1 hypothetical protein ICV36_07790 [Polynucleobacter sp. MWH-UH35A]
MTFETYAPDLGEAAAKYRIDPRFIYKNLERMFSPGPISSVVNIKTGERFPVSVQGLDPGKGIRVKVEELPKVALNSFMGQECYFVAGLEVGKLQFPISGLRSAESGLLACDIPNTMSLLQRREHFRAKAPPDRAFKALIFFAVGKEMIGDIVDISDHGLQLDLRLGATHMEIGTLWKNCTLERLTARTAKFDLIIRSLRSSSVESSRIRVGCELHEPTKLNLNEFYSTRSAIQNARVNRRINYWYQDTSWT